MNQIRIKKILSAMLILSLYLGYVSQAFAADRPIRILSLDGGGVRGMIPATVLAAVEKDTGKRITELFDVMVGTSTGGLITLFLNVPNAQGKQKYSAVDVMGIYRDMSAKVFQKPFLRSLRTLGGLIGSKYSAKPLEELLLEKFGDLRMADTVKDVVITSMDTKYNELFPFSTMLAKKSNIYNFFMRDAGRATSAAPTFFKALELEPLNGGEMLTLVDGGIGANNPGILGVLEAKKLYPNRDYLLVSLGTGKTSELGKVKSKGNLAGGILQMLKPTISGMFTGQNQLSDQAAEAMVSDPSRFFRINPEIDVDMEKMDNVKSDNIKALERIGTDMTKTPAYKAMIEALTN